MSLVTSRLVGCVIVGPYTSQNAVEQPQLVTILQRSAFCRCCDLPCEAIKLSKVSVVRFIVWTRKESDKPAGRPAIISLDHLSLKGMMYLIRLFDCKDCLAGCDELSAD